MKKLLIVITGIALLIVVGLVIALTNANSYLQRNRGWIADQASAALGRKVSFDKISISIFGDVGVRLSNLRIAEDPRFGDQDFVRAGEVKVAVRVLPALSGRIEVRYIVLEQPAIRVVKTTTGFNFDTLGKSAEPEGGQPAAPSAPAATSPSGQQADAAVPLAVLVAAVRVHGAHIEYLDESVTPPAETVIDDLDLNASDVSLDTPVHIDLAATVPGATERNFRLTGTVGPVGTPIDSANVPLDLKLEVGPLVVDQLLGQVAALREISLRCSDPLSFEITAQGTPANIEIGFHFDASRAALSYGTDFYKPAGVPLGLDLSAKSAGNTVTIEHLKLRLASLTLTGRGRVDLTDPPTADLQLDSEPTSLQGWDKLVPALAAYQTSGSTEVHLHIDGPLGGKDLPQVRGTIVMHDVAVKGDGTPVAIDGLSTTIKLEPDRVIVPPTTLRVAGQPVEIEVDVKQLNAPQATFAVRSSEIRLAALGIASKNLRKPEVIRGLDLRGNAATSPALRVDVKLRSAGGTLQDADFESIDADLTYRDGPRVNLHKLAVTVFGGKVTATGTYDAASAKPRFDIDSKIQNLGVADALAILVPAAAKGVGGRLDADLELTGSGSVWDEIREALTGTGRVAIKDGVIRDINLADEVLAGVTGIQGLSALISDSVRKKYPEVFSTGDTNFDALRGAVRIAQGRLNIEDLNLSARDYRILGAGWLGLDGQVDLTANLIAAEKLTADILDSVREASALTGDDGRLRIPFHLVGALPDARPKVDSSFILNALKKGIVQKVIEQLFGGKKKSSKFSGAPGAEAPPAKQPAQELLRKGLKGLFGR